MDKESVPENPPAIQEELIVEPEGELIDQVQEEVIVETEMDIIDQAKLDPTSTYPKANFPEPEASTSDSAKTNEFSFLKEPYSWPPEPQGQNTRDYSAKFIHEITLSRFAKLQAILLDKPYCNSQLKKLFKEGEFAVIEGQLKSVREFAIKELLKQCDRHTTGMHFNVEVKVWAMTMYQRSPLIYRYLRVYFECPSPSSLTKLLNAIPLGCAFDAKLLQQLKRDVRYLCKEDRYCTLLISDMEVDTHLDYDQLRDYIVGFEDLGPLGRSQKVADMVLVFMVRGVHRRWKQPLCFFFADMPIADNSLQPLIIKAVKELQKVGLRVVSTVINQEFAGLFPTAEFTVNSAKVHVVYDVCDLLKQTRDAMLTCAVQFEEGKFAKFEHIREFFEIDRKRQFPMMRALDEEAFNFDNPETKNNVTIAANQLSNRIAAGLETYSTGKKALLPAQAMHTAEFVHEIDQLFDSFTGVEENEPNDYKRLVTVVRRNSAHINYWTKLLVRIEQWKLIDLKTRKDVTADFPFIDGWKTTIKSTIAIWRRLNAVNVDYFCTRALNLDPVENLFLCVRNRGVADKHPSCMEFETALKISILHNLKVPEEVEGNCQDDGDPLLNNLRCFFKAVQDVPNGGDESSSGESFDHEEFESLFPNFGFKQQNPAFL